MVLERTRCVLGATIGNPRLSLGVVLPVYRYLYDDADSESQADCSRTLSTLVRLDRRPPFLARKGVVIISGGHPQAPAKGSASQKRRGPSGLPSLIILLEGMPRLKPAFGVSAN